VTGDPAACDGDGEPTTEADCMLAVYRHDLHKLRGRSHLDATETLAGQRVNESVPHGADRDAALLSRPGGHPEQTVPAHNSPFRLSLGTGAQVIDAVGIDALGDAVQEFVTIQDAATAHRAWLNSAVAAAMNESLYYPYTSLEVPRPADGRAARCVSRRGGLFGFVAGSRRPRGRPDAASDGLAHGSGVPAAHPKSWGPASGATGRHAGAVVRGCLDTAAGAAGRYRPGR